MSHDIDKLTISSLSEEELWLLLVNLCRDPTVKHIDIGTKMSKRAILWADQQIKKISIDSK